MVVKRKRFEDRFSHVELRLGNADESSKGLVQFSENPLVATYGAPQAGTWAGLPLVRPSSGRFLTTQGVEEGKGLEFDEVYIV